MKKDLLKKDFGEVCKEVDCMAIGPKEICYVESMP